MKNEKLAGFQPVFLDVDNLCSFMRHLCSSEEFYARSQFLLQKKHCRSQSAMFVPSTLDEICLSISSLPVAAADLFDHPLPRPA
jgi:hypothetical protein